MLTLHDALELPSLSKFRLVSGEKGLNKPIKEVNILDFEYTEPLSEPFVKDGLFHSGALVLASLLYARSQPDLILPVIKQLYTNDCCGIAIKTVYYSELPEEVIEFSNKYDFPIFLFEKTDFENIIFEVFKSVYQENKINYLEKIIAKILDEGRSVEEKLRLTRQLIPNLDMPFRCEYYKPKQPLDLLTFEHLMNCLWKRESQGRYFFPYKLGVLVIFPSNHKYLTVDDILFKPLYYHGISQDYKKYEDTPYVIQESIYSAEYAEMNNLQDAHFSDLGIMQLLLPNKCNFWVDRFCINIIEKLKGQETEKNSDFFDTVKVYVEEDFDINAVAERLSFHKNTVRYRIQKAKEILGYENNTAGFNQAIYLALSYSKLK